MSTLTFAERVIAIHRALADVPHAFGGALALAYYAEPRATVDIDLNVFLAAERFDEVAGPLEQLGVDADDPSDRVIALRDGQVRLFWDRTPVDLFFAYDDFHFAAARACQDVPFADVTIPVLSAEHLVVCKAIFDRDKDWVDINAIRDLGTSVDTAEVLRWVGRIAGDTDARYDRIAAVLTR